MVDSFDTGSMQGTVIEESPKTGLAGYMATTAGRLVVGGVALVLVLVALGAIAYLYVFNQPEQEPAIIIPAQNTTSSVDATISVRTAPSVQDTFAFRNIFEPTVKPRVTPSPATTDGSTTDTSTGGGGTGTSGVNPADVPPNTIYLDSIVSYDGTPKAVLIWNGKAYEAAPGEQLAGTPWKVVSIEGNTVVLLYGDSTVTLSIGQGVSK